MLRTATRLTTRRHREASGGARRQDGINCVRIAQVRNNGSAVAMSGMVDATLDKGARASTNVVSSPHNRSANVHNVQYAAVPTAKRLATFVAF